MAITSPIGRRRLSPLILAVAVPAALVLSAIVPADRSEATQPSSMPPLQVQPAAGSSMVLNGGFDDGGLDGWIGSYDPADPLTAPEYGAGFGYGGSGGVRLHTGPDRTSRLIQQLGGSWTQYSAGTGELALAPNTTYHLTARIKTTDGVTGTLTFDPVKLFDTKDPVLAVTPASTTSSDWQTVTATVQTGDGYAGGKITVEAYKGTTTGEVYVDDVELIATGGEFLATPSGVPTPDPGVLFDDFDGPALDTEKWLLPSKAWGGPNNGVVPENLSLVPTVEGDAGHGYLVMDAHGDLYDGPVTGTNPYGVYDAVSGKQIDANKRVGSAIATRDYYASGRYEVRAKIAPDLGAVSAFWTFHYIEDDSLPGGKIRNTEIDWEFPTGATDGSVPADQDFATFDRARANTWGGYVPGEGAHHPGRVVLPKNAQGQNHVEDGKFHDYRFDWYSTGKNGDGIPRIEWYLDGVLVHEETFESGDTQNNIGYRAARYWLGVWFPAQSEKALPTGETGWGGTPDFAVSKAYIDWVRITPFTDQAADRYERESTPNFGYGLPDRAPGYSSAAPDTEAPTVPAGLRATASTASSISLAWDPATDNVGVTGYDVSYGATTAHVAGPSAVISGLAPGTAYTFTVRARDAAGNLSAPSDPLTASTGPAGVAVDRVAGDDRFDTAIKISARSFPDGDADVAFVASGQSFADALAAGPAAVALGGPVLLTARDSVRADVLDELRRLKPKRIVVVGGTNAVSDAAYRALAAVQPNISRAGGSDRFETSRRVAVLGFPDGAGQAFVATGSNFPDALSASAAIGAAGPMLLVPGTSSAIDAATEEAVTRLGAEKLWIAGGETVVSPGIEDALDALVPTRRLAGDDRYSTSQAINAQFFEQTGAKHLLLATGANFPDALAGAAWAPVAGGPLALAPGSCVPRTVVASITGLGVTQVTLLGGEQVLGAPVEALAPCAF